MTTKTESLISYAKEILLGIMISALIFIFLSRKKIISWIEKRREVKYKHKLSMSLLESLKSAQERKDFESIYHQRKEYIYCFESSDKMNELFNEINRYQYMPVWPELSLKNTKTTAMEYYNSLSGEVK